MVSNYAVCGVPFLAGFYTKDFILEMFSMRYVNIFSFIYLYIVIYMKFTKNRSGIFIFLVQYFVYRM